MATASFSTSTLPVFTSSNYQIWAIKMRAYLKAFDLWEIVELGEAPIQRHANPTLVQTKQHSEERKALRNENVVENALVAKTKNLKVKVGSSKKNENKGTKTGNDKQKKHGDKFDPCPYCKKRNHTSKYCWYRPNVKCRACKQLGHVEKVCKAKKSNAEGQVAIAEKTKEVEELLFVANLAGELGNNDVWLLDSACSHHMTSNNSLFTDLDTSFRVRVKIENGELLVFASVGTIAIETMAGIRHIANVRYAPYVDQNLLSVGQLAECNYALLFKIGSAQCLTQLVDLSDVWHKRIGHVNFGSLIKMSSEVMVDGLLVIVKPDMLCKVCQYGKQCRKSFPKGRSWKAKKKLELVHLDKSEALMHFFKFKAIVENQAKMKIKTLRSDNGFEFTVVDFEAFLAQFGVEHWLTVTYSPQQNGASERKNRTVVEMARCLLFQNNLPRVFWAEAVNTANYLLNITYTRVLNFKTPYEMWFACKPSAAHLKTFGCVCYAKVPDEKRSKLDAKSVLDVFIGYSERSKGYSLYNVETNKVVTSNEDQYEAESDSFSDIEDEKNAVRGTSTLQDIYSRCSLAMSKPSSFVEANVDPNWKKAMNSEMKMIEKNNTWVLVNRPDNQHVIGLKWIFKIKLNSDGLVNKYKARLVVKGYAQVYGVDYNETFSLVARHDTIRMLATLVAREGWRIYHLNVKFAFLNGILTEDIYVEQPEGYVEKGSEDKVCKLAKALYGLKLARRAWYERMDEHFKKQGFQRSVSESTLYVKSSEGFVLLIVALYMDDLLITDPDNHHLAEFKSQMMCEFEMIDLGLMSYFLGMEVVQAKDHVSLHQTKYAKDLLKRFQMSFCKSVGTSLSFGAKFSKEDGCAKANGQIYRSIIGSLLYLLVTRPDIMFATCLLSRFMQDPSVFHFTRVKRILRYIQGTLNFGLVYKKKESSQLIGYCDNDWAGSVDDSKSTSGFCFSFRSAVFTWNSKKQEVVAQSSTEVEYIACAAALIKPFG
ncbi:Retrotransposon protein, unclassified, putative [Theobroma cacao]|uniref:Retrotransposon protein, unclassified, putative n=1 Tax=Theobroma cacao TaxID=3641 RepID=A0A061FSA1_THECC|nr:Retrotransposon protein, unclassified, putative [Theobroma cacao]